MELEVRYNYSGVKNFWRKIRKKNTRPFRFHQNDFHFQSRFFRMNEPQKWQCYLIAFSIWKRIYYSKLYQIYFYKIRGLVKIFCASILRQINLKGHNLSHQIFFLTCLCSCGLLIGLYSFCSLAYLYKGLK